MKRLSVSWLPVFLIGLVSNVSALNDIVDSPYKESIEALVSDGIVAGYEDGTFRPDQKINRAEFTKILIESQNLNPKICEKDYFSDVSPLVWYGPYVYRAFCDDIVQGDPDGKFYPERLINYAEAAKIINKSFDLPFETSTSTDWYVGYIESLEAEKATPRTNIKPADYITRGEMAYLIDSVRPRSGSVAVVNNVASELPKKEEPKKIVVTDPAEVEPVKVEEVVVELKEEPLTKATPNASLEEGKWYFVSFPQTDPVSSSYDIGTWISFEDGKLSGEGACNTFFGTYEREDSMLTLSNGLAVTERGCFKSEAQEREAQLIENLSLVKGFEVVENRILLIGESKQTVLKLSRNSIIE